MDLQGWSPILIPSPPPSPSHPSGSSQCTSPEHLSHASNLGWRSISHLIIYMFRCCSLRTSHPCLLPQSPSLFYTSVSLFLFCIYLSGLQFSRDMDGPRDCDTEWNKSEREKQVSLVNPYMWNLDKWYSWSYLQSRNRDMWRTNVWKWGKEWVGVTGRLGLMYMHCGCYA